MILPSWLKRKRTSSACSGNALDSWCGCWLLHINISKTKIVHFRQKSQPRTSFEFKCGPSKIEVVPSYKYLGIWLDEHLDFQSCATALTDSARKALGLLISKSKQFGNFPFEAFSSLYESLVIPRMDYGAGVCSLVPSRKRVRNIRLVTFSNILGLHRIFIAQLTA